MADQLKNWFNQDYLNKLAVEIQSVYEPFQIENFVTSTMDETWDSLELKGRVNQITANMQKYLPKDYPAAISILDKVVAVHKSDFGIFFPTFVEMFGLDEKHWDISMDALALYTQYSSSEFAVRPFIINHEEKMMAQMYVWSKHENEHIRRLSSEGCRPALPWGQALAKYKKDPTPILPILEQLKADPSLYVRKSVANNLNDISKTHPDLVAKIAKQWYGKNEHTNWVVKHGCRSLLKKGNKDVLTIFGFTAAAAVSDFAINEVAVSIGGDVAFSFTISTAEEAKIRLEYGIDYVKANGKRNRKIFQISESTFPKNETKRYTKNHSLADLSTRKHYPGVHSITLIVNGEEKGTLDFDLI